MVLDNFQWLGAVEKERWMLQGGERSDYIQTHVSYFSFRLHRKKDGSKWLQYCLLGP